MEYTTEELAFLADGTGIVYYHLGDGTLTSHSPMAKPDLSLLYTAEDDITPEWQEKNIGRRTAATLYGVPVKNIVVSGNVCWVISDSIIESSQELRNRIVPLGAVVIDHANSLFGEKTEDRQIILSLGNLTRPLTYIISIIAGQVTETVLHGHNTNKIFTRTCKEVVRIDITASQTDENYEEYEPPAADIVKELSLIDFLSNHKLKPISLGKKILPWKKFIPLVFVLSFFWAIFQATDIWLGKEVEQLNIKIGQVETEMTSIELALQEGWRSALSSFVKRERKNFNSVFPIIDTAAQILPLRSFRVDKKNIYFEMFGDPADGSSENTRIRDKIKKTFKDCEIKESHVLAQKNEILYSIICTY